MDIGVAVYFDNKLRKLKLQTYQSIRPAKVRVKPPKPAMKNEWNGAAPPKAKAAHKMKKHGSDR